MLDVSTFSGACGTRYAPSQRRGADQHLAGGCPGFAHGIPCSADAGATSGGLIAVQCAGAGLFDFDLFPVGFEFFGEDHGQSGADALSHLGARDDDGDFVLGSDAQICIRREGSPCVTRLDAAR